MRVDWEPQRDDRSDEEQRIAQVAYDACGKIAKSVVVGDNGARADGRVTVVGLVIPWYGLLAFRLRRDDVREAVQTVVGRQALVEVIRLDPSKMRPLL